MDKKYSATRTEPNYTGGGYYSVIGKTNEDGKWFIGGWDGWDYECVRIVDTNVFELEDPDDMFFPEWQEEHLVEDLDGESSKEFYIDMCERVLMDHPDGNYNNHDIKQFLDDLNNGEMECR